MIKLNLVKQLELTNYSDEFYLTLFICSSLPHRNQKEDK